MTLDTTTVDAVLPAEGGLRGRQRVQRRADIIDAARTLFARDGVDETTVASIAAAVGVSPPTVFNHFGSKDGVLIALIVEGTEAARANHDWAATTRDADLHGKLTNLLARVSRVTLDIADRRVWRYAEAATVRQPETEVAEAYRQVNRELTVVLIDFFAGYDLRLLRGDAGDPAVLGPMFHDLWTPHFIELITQEDMTLSDHNARVGARMADIMSMIFDPASITHPAARKDRA